MLRRRPLPFNPSLTPMDEEGSRHFSYPPKSSAFLSPSPQSSPDSQRGESSSDDSFPPTPPPKDFAVLRVRKRSSSISSLDSCASSSSSSSSDSTKSELSLMRRHHIRRERRERPPPPRPLPPIPVYVKPSLPPIVTNPIASPRPSPPSSLFPAVPPTACSTPAPSISLDAASAATQDSIDWDDIEKVLGCERRASTMTRRDSRISYGPREPK